MAAGVYNFTIEQGATLTRTFTAYTDADATLPLDLTGYTARMKIRQDPSATVIISLTNGSGITLGGTAGTIIVVISAAVTTTLDDGYVYRYDLELIAADGAVTRLVKGLITVDPEVTS